MTAVEKINAEVPCPHSDTVPGEPEHANRYGRGGWNDGGFHHCECGAIISWSTRPVGGGVVSAHVQPAQLRPRPDQVLAGLSTPDDRNTK